MKQCICPNCGEYITTSQIEDDGRTDRHFFAWKNPFGKKALKSIPDEAEKSRITLLRLVA